MKPLAATLTALTTVAASAAIALPTLHSNAAPQPDFDMRTVPTVGNRATAHVWATDPTVPIVVLGARLNKDCAAPGVLNERLNRTAQFIHLHPLNTIIVSGGATQRGCATEAAAMEQGLRARGVINPIVQEGNSDSTVQNAHNIANMRPEKKMVLISSADHVPRAQRNFREYGIETAGAAIF